MGKRVSSDLKSRLCAELGTHTTKVTASKITDAQLETIRKKLYQLSKDDFISYDFLQIGIDKSGILLYLTPGCSTKVTHKQRSI